MDYPWQSRIFGALRHPTEIAVLLEPAAGGWRLPQVTGENIWMSSMDRITPAFSAQLGVPVWGLRQIHVNSDSQARSLEAVIELEALNALPADGRWFDAAALGTALLDRTDLRPSLLAALEERISGRVPALRPPWARPGWLPRVRRWIETEAGRAGHQVVEVQPVKQWSISCVLRVKTTGPDLFFKTTNRHMPLFANEAGITRALADRFADCVAAPLAVHTGEDWMLMPAFTPLSGAEDIPGLYRRFAELQIESIPQTSAILGEGALDRRLETLARQIDPLLTDPLATGRMDPAEAAELQALAPVFKDLLARLAACGIPDTIVHGDLHPGNAAVHAAKVVFFDWTDACIAHPFFDLFSLSWFDEAQEAACLEAYLGPWRALIPVPRFDEAVCLARIVLHLHHAVSYQHIVANLEPAAQPELDITHTILADALRLVREYLAAGGS